MSSIISLWMNTFLIVCFKMDLLVYFLFDSAPKSHVKWLGKSPGCSAQPGPTWLFSNRTYLRSWGYWCSLLHLDLGYPVLNLETLTLIAYCEVNQNVCFILCIDCLVSIKFYFSSICSSLTCFIIKIMKNRWFKSTVSKNEPHQYNNNLLPIRISYMILFILCFILNKTIIKTYWIQFSNLVSCSMRTNCFILIFQSTLLFEGTRIF